MLKTNEITYKLFARYFLLAIFSICILACNNAGDRKRPYGYIKIGAISEFKEGTTYLPKLRLLLTLDKYGYSVMSTMCTYDLSPLKKVAVGDSYIWKSLYTDSSYQADGSVLTGPATTPLPYYEMTIAEDDSAGKIYSLYVYIGREKPENWRLRKIANQ